MKQLTITCLFFFSVSFCFAQTTSVVSASLKKNIYENDKWIDLAGAGEVFVPKELYYENDFSEPKRDTLAFFHLRPDVEKAFGYAHAVKIGDKIKISGAVSMDDAGNPTAKGDMLQQIKNCYADLDKVLKHYNCTFDDVVAENVFTTNMGEFLKQSGFRNSIYKKHFPTGSWLEVKGLALPEFLIEIELEVHKSK
jgi:enamine deaminase RidA (YjgF/YER057c/UK114 family)